MSAYSIFFEGFDKLSIIACKTKERQSIETEVTLVDFIYAGKFLI